MFFIVLYISHLAIPAWYNYFRRLIASWHDRLLGPVHTPSLIEQNTLNKYKIHQVNLSQFYLYYMCLMQTKAEHSLFVELQKWEK